MTKSQSKRDNSELRNRASGGRERGSAYLVTLFALIVLTMVGLSVSLITQSEMQIGANERVSNRVFYAADTGVSLATARALVSADYTSQTYVLQDPMPRSTVAMEHSIAISPFYPLLNSPCNLCQINNAGQYGAKVLYKTNHGVTSQATRQGGASDTPIAFRSVSTMIEVQPWDPPSEAFLALNNPEELKKLKF